MSTAKINSSYAEPPPPYTSTPQSGSYPTPVEYGQNVVRKGTVDGYEWRCRNQSKDNRLDVVRSVRKGTWFSESKLAITIILRLTRYWFGKSMNAFVVNDLKVNKKGKGSI
ncbi:hypothetical protein TNCV_5050361 [Trichonephila clavipes]|nr:hypothetical protein TNCV_5050361 [Trichonephila clavipes]